MRRFESHSCHSFRIIRMYVFSTRWWNCKGAYKILPFGTVFTNSCEATNSPSFNLLKVWLTLAANNKTKRQRPFCGKQLTFSKSKKETNNKRWIRTWLECKLSDKTGEFIFFQARAGLGKPVHSSSQQTFVMSLKQDLGPVRKQKRVYR